MNSKIFLFLCCTVVAVSTLKAEEQTKKESIKREKQMDQRVSELMADRVGLKKEIELKAIAIVEDALVEEEEALLYPADDLYGSNWDTRWVDPYKMAEIAFPDSSEIDCSTFFLPITTELRVTSKYGPRRRRMHKGIDLKVQVGDTIYAAFNGKIRIRNFQRRGYGNYLVIRHPNGLETVYGHLSRSLVEVNEIVRAGQPIGLGGNTGRSTGSHLHFETRFLGQAINPADIIDFENGVPHQDLYVFRNVKINGRKSNIYTSSNNQQVYYRIKSGDTLGAIARRYGTTVGELCRLNGLKPTSQLRIGQSIRCNAARDAQTVDTKASTKDTNASAQVAKADKTVKTTVEAVASVSNSTYNNGSVPVYHRIKSGDTLGAMAKKYGTTVSHICELNGFTKTTVLKLGSSVRCI